MLVLKCSACKKKLWRYDKIGPGEVLRCHKDRIKKIYTQIIEDEKVNIRVQRARLWVTPERGHFT